MAPLRLTPSAFCLSLPTLLYLLLLLANCPLLTTRRRRQPNFSIDAEPGIAEYVFDFVCIMWPITVGLLLVANMDLVQSAVLGGLCW